MKAARKSVSDRIERMRSRISNVGQVERLHNYIFKFATENEQEDTEEPTRKGWELVAAIFFQNTKLSQVKSPLVISHNPYWAKIFYYL